MNAANEYSPITLDLAVAEVGNAARKRAAFFGESVDVPRLSHSKCLMFIKSCMIVNSSDLAGHAYEIALENRTTFYDSLFLAAANLEDVPLLTLDKKCIWRQRRKTMCRCFRRYCITLSPGVTYRVLPIVNFASGPYPQNKHTISGF